MSSHPQVKRHTKADRFVHWSAALSIFALIFTGIGQMPVYKRYMVADLPGMAWTADYSVTLFIHYAAAIVLIGVAAYHITYAIKSRSFGLLPRKGDVKESVAIVGAMITGKEEPPSGKFLAEQRLAYAFIAGVVGVLIITGLFKVAKNLPFLSLPNGFLVVNTWVHNIFTGLMIVGIIAHLGAFLLKPNRPLFKSMFTGTVDADYAKHRHSLWNPKRSA